MSRDGGSFPDPGPAWFFYGVWGALGLATVALVAWIATRRRCRAARRAVGAGTVLAGAVATVLLWASAVEVTGRPGDDVVTCPYDAVGMAASSGRLADVDRRCRSSSIVRVGWGAAAVVGAAGFAVVLTHGSRRRPVGPR